MILDGSRLSIETPVELNAYIETNVHHIIGPDTRLPILLTFVSGTQAETVAQMILAST